jgi:HK97 family phage prohead protease
MSIETRSNGTIAPANGLRISGVAVTWDTYDMGNEYERIDPNAFAKSLEDPSDIALLWNHDTSKPLARVRAGNLRLYTDSNGLGFEATLPDTPTAREAHQLIKSGVVSQCSFGFIVRGERFEKGEDGKPIRVITDAELREVSVVTFPANSATSVQARSENPKPRRTYYLPPEA